ncbi:GNAT family N-acetyltransferase [Nocardia fusca]|uniref:GNAT family N-acetyltransferase n=1 Tax=Nocardia fusca TaxID=941183 RepID=UPI0037B6D11F
MRTDDLFDFDEDDIDELLWPRPRYPLLRKLNPRRGLLRWHARRVVSFEYRGPAFTEGAGHESRSITFWDRRSPNSDVGIVSYRICHECRWGYIDSIDVRERLWGRGIATRALAEIREQVPGYTWRTSMHKNEAKSFWSLLVERTGEDYIDTDRYCPHIRRPPT